jgi:multiple sugar transport system substrate-binding protein
MFVLTAVCVLALPVFAGAQREMTAPASVRFWYHFDDPEVAVTPLVQKFQAENPSIKVVPERVAWDAYNQKLLTAVAAGDPPDVSQVKLWWQPQLVEAGALEPVDSYLASWEGRDDVFDKVWDLTRYTDGKQYLMPLQMVILYTYYRVDMFKDLGLTPAKTREEFLQNSLKLTRDTNGDGTKDVYGFGIRGARGGHDWWGTFVLSSGAQFFDAQGRSGLTTQKAIDANQWYIDLFRVHKVSPPTTPSDGFREIIANMTSGLTATTIHHLGSSATMEEALGDKISASPVPKGTEGYWTSFGDEENGMFAASKAKDAAFAWMAFLATAENNATWQKASGQVSINKSNAAGVTNRFLKATTDSSDFAGVLPAHPRTAEFVESVWPTTMQRAFLGEIGSKEMMQTFADLFAKR